MCVLGYYIHNFDPFLVKFPPSWAIRGIRWYGAAYLVAFWLASRFLKRAYECNILKLSGTQQQNFLFAAFCGMLIGGRLGYALLYKFDYYATRPLEIFAIWEGGMASHSGFIGIFFSLLLFGRRYGYSVFSLADLTVPIGTLGIFLGRCANFINGELYGTVTEVPWAVIFEHSRLPRHPSQLYEAVGEGLLLFFWSLHFIRRNAHLKTHPGLLASHFLIYYGIIRYILEIFREPDATLIGFLSRGQFYSIFMILVGICCTFFLKKHPQNGCVFQ